jgi:hypothetical protein
MKTLKVLCALLSFGPFALGRDEEQVPLGVAPNITVLSPEKVKQWVVPAWYSA